MVRPRDLTVLRLRTSSNFVACSTGMLAGLDPFKILSHIRGGATIEIGQIRPVGHEASAFHEVLRIEHLGHPVPIG